MKRFMLNTLMLSLTVALWGCGGSGDDPEPETPFITVSSETISAPADGGTYTVNVTTTGKEWGISMGDNFFTAKAQNTGAPSGSIIITIPVNIDTETRTGTITVMSGVARKTINVNQAAAEKATYNAPEGYKLVWQDEFNEGTELNPNDWTHEVQKDHWVNNEMQNYVKHGHLCNHTSFSIVCEISLIYFFTNKWCRIKCRQGAEYVGLENNLSQICYQNKVPSFHGYFGDL